MITDREPSEGPALREFRESDALRELDAPPVDALHPIAAVLQEALAAADPAAVKKAGDDLLARLAVHYGVAAPKLKVLGSRPRKTHEGGHSELFGDYTFANETIRVWMRTAVLGKVTSFRGLLNTLIHEFCHHLDVKRLGFSSTPHTRGFYARVDVLYHLALATPPEKRKPLVWIRMGRVWRIDWSKLR